MAKYEISELQNWQHQPAIVAKRVTDAGTDMQLLVDYSAGTNPVYYGLGTQGLATSGAGWLIRKVVYDGNSNPTSVKTAAIDGTNIWDNRASLTYT